MKKNSQLLCEDVDDVNRQTYGVIMSQLMKY